MVKKGNPAEAIVQTARQENADLIMMPSHGFTFNQFLLSSVTTRVRNEAECPIWTGTHIEEPPAGKFSIRNVLCAVDFRPHSHRTVLWAGLLAAEFGARLTLADVTAAVEFWGPGGSYVDQKWKKALVADASQHIAGLQKDLAVKADVFIGSGDVPTVLSQAAKQTNADLLVTGCRPYGENLRTRGYSIIRSVPIPVLSVGAA
jgi:nucleotide-binding universal stress UspA family protein